jgi:hypothetical protein
VPARLALVPVLPTAPTYRHTLLLRTGTRTAAFQNNLNVSESGNQAIYDAPLADEVFAEPIRYQEAVTLRSLSRLNLLCLYGQAIGCLSFKTWLPYLHYGMQMIVPY